jgi:hypothetical protein
VIRVTKRQSWTSAAEAGWLAPQDKERFLVQPGAVPVVTEGRKIVGYFHVETGRRPAMSAQYRRKSASSDSFNAR